MISRPVSSPQAPAGGWSVARAIPVISQSARSRRHRQLERALDRVVGLSGCALENPEAAPPLSATFGLYFIEHDPSG